jgi:hypothetical protein
MKTLYSILFFADTAALIKLSSLFLLNIDTGRHFLFLLVLLAGMALSIALLIYLLSAYINLPATRRQR